MANVRHHLLTRCKPIALAVALAWPAFVLAQMPGGGKVVVPGSATINTRDPNHYVVTQTGNKAIINWDSFSVGDGNSVKFVQPGRDSVVLNRVVGNDVSSIFGSVTGNGQIFLVNPNGIYFAPGATLDVGGLVASTLNIRDKDFLAGRYVFTRGDSIGRAEVINDGVLRARDGGYVVLAGDYAANRGVVEAKLGTVMLGSAAKMTLDVNGDSLVSYAMNERNLTELAGVANSGQLMADGGRVVMTAMTARSLTGAAVNNTGVIQARGVEEKGGAVYLLADDAGIAMGNTSKIDVSGARGGGTVLVGGNYQGGGSEVHASRVDVAAGATIKADAIVKGDGGKVVLWSDGATDFKGNISARGGASGGDGGSVEVSGEHLAYSGKVNTLAPKGKAGELLLDPADITISSSADDHITSGSPFQNSDNTGASNLDVATLLGALAGGNVIVSTGAGTGGSGTITVNAAITWSSVHSLSLVANSKIDIKAAITGSNAASTLALFAGSNQGVTQSAAINVNRLVLAGDGNYTLTNTSNSINILSTANTAPLGGTINQINGKLSLVNTGGLVLDTVKSTGQMSLSVGGALTQTGTVKAGGLEVVSTAGDVTLANSGNTVGTLAVDAVGAVSYRDSGALTVGSVGGTSGIASGNNAVTLRSGTTMAIQDTLDAGNADVSLQSAGAMTQSAGIKGDGLRLTGSGATTLENGANNFDTIASSRSGVTSIRNNHDTEIGTVGGTSGINTGGNRLTLKVRGALTQSQAITAGGLEIINDGTTDNVTLTNANNSFSSLAVNTDGGDVSLRNKSAFRTQKVGNTTGVTTHDGDLTIKNTATMTLGGSSTSGRVDAGDGTVTLNSYRVFQGSNGEVVAKTLKVNTTNYVGLSGTGNNSIQKLEVNATGGGYGDVAFDLNNNRGITLGTGGADSITTQNTHVKVVANGGITVAGNVDTGTGHLGLFANGTVDTGTSTIKVGALGASGSDLKLDRDTNGINNANGRIQTKVIAAKTNGDFGYTAPKDLTVSSNVWGLSGITARHVYIDTGKFVGYDRTKPYSDFYDATTGKYKAGLVLDGGITASGSVYLHSDSGVFQWTSDNTKSPPGRDGAARIKADQLMVDGEGQFSLLDPKNEVRQFSGVALGSIMFATSTPLTIKSLKFDGLGVTRTITGVRANTAVISGSEANGDAEYSAHNILLASADDPGAGALAMDIQQNITADTRGGSTINLSVGASDNHKETALVRTNGGIIKGNLLVLGADAGKGTFEVKTNVFSLSAAGGHSMLIDNSLYTGTLNVLGLGSAQGGGTPTPVGNVFLTTGGDMLLLGGKSSGDFLQLRADNLDVFGDMEMKDGARVLLQPYHMNRSVGVHNAHDYLGYNVQTNYSRSTLQRFSQTAAIYVGSTPAIMNQSSDVPGAVKNLNLSNYIRIGADGSGGLQMGYRSLSAETAYSGSAPSIWAGFLGDVYNLRLVGKSVAIRGFNVTGNQVHIFTDDLSMDEAASNYALASNTDVTLRGYLNRTVWVGYRGNGSEAGFTEAILKKFPDGTNIIISGSTDQPLTDTGQAICSGCVDIHLAKNGQFSLGNRKLTLSTTQEVFGYLSDGHQVEFIDLPIVGKYTAADWNGGNNPQLKKVQGAFINADGTQGKAGGTWGGCPNLSSCQGTNPSTPTGPGTGTTPVDPGGGGGGGTGGGGDPGNNTPPPPPPAKGPDEPSKTTNNANNTGDTNNTGGNPGDNHSGVTDGTGGTGDPNDGMGDGGPSGSGDPSPGGPGSSTGGDDPSSGTGPGDGGPGDSHSTGGNPGDGTGTGSSGSGDGSGTGGSGGGDGSGGSGSGSGSGGGGDGSGSGSGASGNGDGSGGSGNGSGSGSGGDGSGGNGSGSGGDGSGSGDGSGGSGSGTGSDSGGGDGTGGSGSGSGNGGDGSGSGSGSGSGNGDGSGSGSGDGSGSGAGSGSGDGTGSGSATGSGDGSGSGSGNGSGSGSGDGDGASGSDHGSGAADGSGDGSGSGAGKDGGSGDGTDSGSGTGSGTGSGDGDGSAAGSDSGSGSASGEGDGNGSGSGRGSGSADDSGDGSGSGSGKASGSGDGSDTSGGSGRGDGTGNGEGGKGGGSGGGDDSGSGSGRDGASGDGGASKGGDSSGKDGGGKGKPQERFCVGQQGMQQRSNKELPEQGGSLANKPLVEVRNGGVNMDGGDCSKQQQAKSGSGSGGARK